MPVAWPSACTTAGPVAVIVQRTGHPLASQVRIARTWTARVVGLLATPVFPDGTGLILPRCHSIHTIGMRYPIDAVFVDRSGRIVALKARLGPGRIIPPVSRGWAVVELPGGTLEHHDVRPGDVLAVRASWSGW